MRIRPVFVYALIVVVALAIGVSLMEVGLDITEKRQQITMAGYQRTSPVTIIQDSSGGVWSSAQMLVACEAQSEENQVRLDSMVFDKSMNTYTMIISGEFASLLGYYQWFENEALYHRLTEMQLTSLTGEEKSTQQLRIAFTLGS